jgi:hypothetical protein
MALPHRSDAIENAVQLGAPGPDFRTWETTNLLRAISERLPHRRWLAIRPLRGQHRIQNLLGDFLDCAR